VRWRFFLITFVWLVLSCGTVEAQRAVILVRHAERLDDSTDSPLSKAGEARAVRLAGQLKDAGIRAIYTTQYARTIQTAEPIASALGLKPITITASDVAALVNRLRTQNMNDVVLVIGHSNTLPSILTALGATEQITIADNQYDDLFVFIPGSPSILLRLHF
jgi:broad specificity phosphatase PhoE